MIPAEMKRLILMMAAAASVVVAMPLAAPALARDGDQGRRVERQDRGRGPPADRGGRRYEDDRGGRRYDRDRGGRRYDDAGDRGGRRYDDDRGGRRYDDDRGGRRYDDGRRERVPALGYGDDRRRYEERPRYEGGPPRGFAPPPSARRGGYLPDSYRGGVVNDYRRYRLRPPPAGYNWVRVGAGFALVSEDGRIFDMVQ